MDESEFATSSDFDVSLSRLAETLFPIQSSSNNLPSTPTEPIHSQSESTYSQPESICSDDLPGSEDFSFLQPRERIRRSWIWNHGHSVHRAGKESWVCDLCSTKPKHYSVACP